MDWQRKEDRTELEVGICRLYAHQGRDASAVADEEANFQWAHLAAGKESDPQYHAYRIARSYQS